MKKTPPPQTIAEAVERLMLTLGAPRLSAFAAESQERLGNFHFSLGLYIRNHYGIFDRHSALLKDCEVQAGHSVDPDEASMMVLQALWKRLHS